MVYIKVKLQICLLSLLLLRMVLSFLCNKGNIQELCFQEVNSNQLTFFNYLLCIHRSFDRIGSHEWAKQCSEEAGQDYDPVNKCVNSDTGLNLFIKSIQKSKAHQANVSCTIFIGGHKRCIRDGGDWYDCPEGNSVKDFVKSIKNAYKQNEINYY